MVNDTTAQQYRPAAGRPPWRIEVVDQGEIGGLPVHRTRDGDGRLVLQLGRGVLINEALAMYLSDFLPGVFDQYPPAP
jgi:hypothetical protein